MLCSLSLHYSGQLIEGKYGMLKKQFLTATLATRLSLEVVADPQLKELPLVELQQRLNVINTKLADYSLRSDIGSIGYRSALSKKDGMHRNRVSTGDSNRRDNTRSCNSAGCSRKIPRRRLSTSAPHQLK